MHDKLASVYIKRLSFHGGTTLDLTDNSIVVFVGPNNSGKSLSLKEINYLSREGSARTQSVSSIELQRIGEENTVSKILEPYRSRSDGQYYLGDNEFRTTSDRDISRAWQGNGGLGHLTDFFVAHLSTGKRLADSDPAEIFEASKYRSGYHPIHNLYLDSDKELEISGLFRQYFGSDLIVHRTPGRTIPLYIGERPKFAGTETSTSRTYLDKVEELEALEDQGDGLRSFVSILLRIWTGNHSILLIDEPEAFLHPPQARAMGELISSGIDYQRQVFVATHSNDVIQGLLSKYPERVSFVRLERHKGLSSATYLSNAKVSELWRDPILRYSNILNGLFHSQVVVTESDADCRFYEAVADACGLSAQSTFYTYAGGKDRIPVIVQALTALHVPVRSVVDIDVFAGDKAIRGIIEAYGCDWNDFKPDIINIRNVIQSRKTWLLGLGFKDRVNAVLNTLKDTEVVPKDKLKAIETAMREASPWDVIKDGGMNAIPSGDPARQLQRLVASLKGIGIHVVPVGQMERFCTSVGRHGPQWVAEVLKRDLSTDPELTGARSFVGELTKTDEENDVADRTHRFNPKRISLTRAQKTRIKLYDTVLKVGNIGKSVFYITLASYFTMLAVDLMFSKLATISP